jgi:hypothetical protein
LNSYNWQSGCPNYQMTAFVFFIFKSAGEGEGWFEGDSTWLIHYKKNTKNTDSHPAVLLNSFKFCAPVVFVWFWLFFSCLRRWGRSEGMTGRHVFAKMWGFFLTFFCIWSVSLLISCLYLSYLTLNSCFVLFYYYYWSYIYWF